MTLRITGKEHHKTHRETVVKFLLLVLLLLTYFGYLAWEYGFATGGIISVITWSFFVLCTPVADAGFLLDFPVRLLFGTRMVMTELLVWLLAISVNLAAVNFSPDVYDATFLTSIFYKILTTPYPYWSIILLCAAGTFLSIYFGDEMMDVAAHRDREKYHKHGFIYKMIVSVTIFVLIIALYYHLLDTLGVSV